MTPQTQQNLIEDCEYDLFARGICVGDHKVSASCCRGVWSFHRPTNLIPVVAISPCTFRYPGDPYKVLLCFICFVLVYMSLRLGVAVNDPYRGQDARPVGFDNLPVDDHLIQNHMRLLDVEHNLWVPIAARRQRPK